MHYSRKQTRAYFVRRKGNRNGTKGGKWSNINATLGVQTVKMTIKKCWRYKSDLVAINGILCERLFACLLLLLNTEKFLRLCLSVTAFIHLPFSLLRLFIPCRSRAKGILISTVVIRNRRRKKMVQWRYQILARERIYFCDNWSSLTVDIFVY